MNFSGEATFNPKKAGKQWKGIVSDKGFIQCPIALLKHLTFEELAYLGFLIHWMFFRVENESLEHQRGEFYCPVKTVVNFSPLTSEYVQKRILKQLADKNILTMKIRRKSIQVKGMQWPKTNRYLKINFDVLENLCIPPEVRALRALPYGEYLQTEHWKALRLRVLKSAVYRCQMCNADKPLDVHHRTYKRLGRERLSDLTALCRDCHEKFHKEFERNE